MSDLGERVLVLPARKMKAFQEAAEKLAYAMMFGKVDVELKRMTELPVWGEQPKAQGNGIVLPTFSVSPLAYISQVGEHLLTLPQHLEPFAVGYTAAVTGKSANSSEGEKGGDAFTAMWLSKLARGTADLYVSQILSIPRLGELGAKQLIADIEYLVNVLQALGVTPHPKLMQCVEALGATEEESKATTKEGGNLQLLKAIGIKRGF